jgi:hypothetical protein
MRAAYLLALGLPLAASFRSVSRKTLQRTARHYVPTPVDPALIAQQLTVVAVTGGAGFVWWTVTVPAKRLEVSRSKKNGEIAELLDELDEAEVVGDKKLERWLLTDWREPSRRKEPALPMLPKSKFNSGDNPIIAAMALILSFGIANALAERGMALL